jgi:transposase-like protein
MEENLNLDYHRARLIIKSLNTSKTIKEAAEKCGLTKRTFHTWRKNYNIKKVKNGKYERELLYWQVSIQ